MNNANYQTLLPAVGAFSALVLGFAVADLSNFRWLGALVLISLGVVTSWFMFERAGFWRTVFAISVAIMGFIISHPLGSVLGSYGSVLIISTVVALVVYALTPRQRVA